MYHFRGFALRILCDVLYSVERSMFGKDIFYEVKAISGRETKSYVEAAESESKRKYYNHQMNLSNNKCKGSTTFPSTIVMSLSAERKRLPLHGKYYPKQDHITKW